MVLLNKKFIKVNIFSIYVEMAKDIKNSKDRKRKMFFQKLFKVMKEYEKNNNIGICEEVYISVDELCEQNLFSTDDIPIDRDLLTNTVLIASAEGNFEVAKKLSVLLLENIDITINDVGEEIANYVFDNCDRYDEFISGKCTRVVYSEKENKLEERTIAPKRPLKRQKLIDKK